MIAAEKWNVTEALFFFFLFNFLSFWWHPPSPLLHSINRELLLFLSFVKFFFLLFRNVFLFWLHKSSLFLFHLLRRRPFSCRSNSRWRIPFFLSPRIWVNVYFSLSTVFPDASDLPTAFPPSFLPLPCVPRHFPGGSTWSPMANLDSLSLLPPPPYPNLLPGERTLQPCLTAVPHSWIFLIFFLPFFSSSTRR